MQDLIKKNNETSIVQLIVFSAGKEEFGVYIDSVREIIKNGVVTPIPEAPKFITGIINVRGEIVTTIDVKSRFGLQYDENLQPKHVIVTKQDDMLYGLIVDEVIEVLRIQETDIKPPPALLSNIEHDYVKGVTSFDNRLIIILDLNKMLSQDELILLKNARTQL